MEESSKTIEKYNAEKVGEFKFFTTALPGSVYEAVLNLVKKNTICLEHPSKY